MSGTTARPRSSRKTTSVSNSALLSLRGLPMNSTVQARSRSGVSRPAGADGSAMSLAIVENIHGGHTRARAEAASRQLLPKNPDRNTRVLFIELGRFLVEKLFGSGASSSELLGQAIVLCFDSGHLLPLTLPAYPPFSSAASLTRLDMSLP